MKLTFAWVGGPTWVLEAEGLRIGCDPSLSPAGSVRSFGWFRSRRLSDPIYTSATFDRIAVWLITHGHADHLDEPGLRQIREDAIVLTHPSASSRLRRGARHLHRMRWGERCNLRDLAPESAGVSAPNPLDVTVEAIPAIHGTRPWAAWAAGGVNGYWLSLQGRGEATSIYVTGDTVLHPKLTRALQGRRVDLLVANVGAARRGAWTGTLTLSAAMLARLMRLVRPAVTIPVHFGTFEHYAEPQGALEDLRDPTIRILHPGARHEITLGSSTIGKGDARAASREGGVP
jgi:L-ascorbate metabolism protein UlaG (beta-lactamase superfamily)